MVSVSEGDLSFILSSNNSFVSIYHTLQNLSGSSSKNEIAHHMDSQVELAYRTSKKTTYKMIDEAVELGNIIMIKHLRQGQSDQVEFNDNNNLNILTFEIDRVQSLALEFSRIALDDLKKLENAIMSSHKHIRNMISLEQVMYHTLMSRFAVLIESRITNTGDCEILYLRLAKILVTLDESNKATLRLTAESMKEIEMDGFKSKPDIALRLMTPVILEHSVNIMEEIMSNLDQIH